MRNSCGYTCTSLANIIVSIPCKVNIISLQAWTGLQSSSSFRVPEFLERRLMKVVRFSNLSTDRLCPQGISLVLLSVRGWVDLRVMVRPKGLRQRKIPVSPLEIEPTTFGIWGQCLNKLRHHMPLFIPCNLLITEEYLQSNFQDCCFIQIPFSENSFSELRVI